MYSRPNVSTLQSSVFIRGDLKLQRDFLYTREVTSFAKKVEIFLWYIPIIRYSVAIYSYGQRRCLEAWHINMNQHALNRDDGSYLPQEYLHLVGK